MTQAEAAYESPRLSQEEGRRFQSRWDELQAGFVDDPRGSLDGADQLLSDVHEAATRRVDEERRALKGRWQPEDTGPQVAGATYRDAGRRCLLVASEPRLRAGKSAHRFCVSDAELRARRFIVRASRLPNGDPILEGFVDRKQASWIVVERSTVAPGAWRLPAAEGSGRNPAHGTKMTPVQPVEGLGTTRLFIPSRLKARSPSRSGTVRTIRTSHRTFAGESSISA